MAGKDAIIEKIISDAQKIVNSTNEEGSNKAKEIVDLAYNDARIYREKNMQQSYLEREEILQRKETAGRLEVKKLILSAKQTVLNKVFVSAVDVIRNSSEYPELLLSMLASASDGDTVTICKKDSKFIDTKVVANFAKKKGISLKLNPNYGEFEGGMIFSGNGADKNMTLEVELSGIRDELEPEIARLLFGK